MEVLTDKFIVKEKDKEGKKFDNVSRITLVSKDTSLTLDYNSHLFKVNIDDLLEVTLYEGINDDSLIPTDYVYVMQGKVYQVDERDSFVVINASFGGLCMILSILQDKARNISEFSDIVIGLKHV
ncbi:subunit Rpb8 of RNA polymerase [Hamiltosporidium tvaerminnensis]|uniref:Subunit Rpb2 of DNA-directed RNA polymerase II n=1 Tax=Hamiltosporidium tvaerminnensis TaxID=1176355 RepID=A0A4Q9LCX9_9MICR|nr:DNA-directed RNA polymerases I, II, and III subunit RPABC3 [Hamiltosporidium tvaerminnensis]TBU01875.1 subunit Rpb2 of DNA-directed RNA polymerase II [Hamiltosporidium tvaerminnensis]TBU05728.1 subunit Rpb8 of RNA polymerase [Hamiltosporidium tvaerminnensis]